MKKSKRFSKQVMVDYLQKWADNLDLGFDPTDGYAQVENKSKAMNRQYAQWDTLNCIISDIEQGGL